MYNFRGIQKTVPMIYLAMFHIFPGVGTLRRSRGTGPIIESEEAIISPVERFGLKDRWQQWNGKKWNWLFITWTVAGFCHDVLAPSRVKSYSIAMVHSSCFTGFHVREILFHSPRWWIHIRSMTIKTHRNIEWWMIFYESFWSQSHSMETSKLSDNWMILGAHAILLHHHHHHHHNNNNNKKNNKSACLRNYQTNNQASKQTNRSYNSVLEFSLNM